MAKSSVYLKWLLALFVVIAIMVVWQLTKMPEEFEEIPEQVEEIDWEEVDKITFMANEDVYVSKVGYDYHVLTEDTTYLLPNEKVVALFRSFNDLKTADLKQVNFQEWIKSQPDSLGIILKLYRNTEEVLDLYIRPENRNSYIRYPEREIVYQTRDLTEDQFQWLDSLARSISQRDDL